MDEEGKRSDWSAHPQLPQVCGSRVSLDAVQSTLYSVRNTGLLKATT